MRAPTAAFLLCLAAAAAGLGGCLQAVSVFSHTKRLARVELLLEQAPGLLTD